MYKERIKIHSIKFKIGALQNFILVLVKDCPQDIRFIPCVIKEESKRDERKELIIVFSREYKKGTEDK